MTRIKLVHTGSQPMSPIGLNVRIGWRKVFYLYENESTKMIEINSGRNAIVVSGGSEVFVSFEYCFLDRDYYVYVSNSSINVEVMDFGRCSNDFNLENYMGKWHQIASIPQNYERGLKSQTAFYTMLQDRVQVVNSAKDIKLGTHREIVGSATIVSDPHVLNVKFKTAPKNTPEWYPNYIVHYTDYVTYSLVGSPDKTSLYVLARSTTLSDCNYSELLRIAAKLGYDVSKLIMSTQ